MGIEIGKDEDRKKFIRCLAQQRSSPDEIAQIAEVSLDYVQSVPASENGARQLILADVTNTTPANGNVFFYWRRWIVRKTDKINQ
jgi:hypothetical protein